jgi:hypothetical protein
MLKLNTVRASATATSWVVWLVVIVTIWAEMAPGLKNWLAGLTGHHWVTKGWVSIIAYVLLLAAFRAFRAEPDEAATSRSMFWANASCVGGLLALLAFYYRHM